MLANLSRLGGVYPLITEASCGEKADLVANESEDYRGEGNGKNTSRPVFCQKEKEHGVLTLRSLF